MPPYAAVQVVPGVRHTRGTPPAVVETDAATWLALATGELGLGRRARHRPGHRQRRARRPDAVPATRARAPEASRAPSVRSGRRLTLERLAAGRGDLALDRVGQRRRPRWRPDVDELVVRRLLDPLVPSSASAPSVKTPGHQEAARGRVRSCRRSGRTRRPASSDRRWRCSARSPGRASTDALAAGVGAGPEADHGGERRSKPPAGVGSARWLGSTRSAPRAVSRLGSSGRSLGLGRRLLGLAGRCRRSAVSSSSSPLSRKNPPTAAADSTSTSTTARDDQRGLGRRRRRGRRTPAPP